MKRGQKWSDEGVKALLVVLKGKLEEVEGMSEERLNGECGKRVELKRYVGESRKIREQALKEWLWLNTMNGGIQVVRDVKVSVTPVSIEDELEKVVKLLTEEDSATEQNPGGCTHGIRLLARMPHLCRANL